MTGFCVLGCGTMGKALLTGIFDSVAENGVPTDVPFAVPDKYFACVKFAKEVEDGQRLLGGRAEFVQHSGNVRAAEQSQYVLLACKPQVASEVLGVAGMREALKGKLVLSILAGKTIDQLQSMVDESTRVVRIMPNTASRIRESMSVICAGPRATPTDVEFAEWVFSGIGRTMQLDERLIDAATALCGSGPAFVATMIEAMTDGGIMMGIPFRQAQELAAQTMVGTAKMVISGQHPAMIRNDVSIPLAVPSVVCWRLKTANSVVPLLAVSRRPRSGHLVWASKRPGLFCPFGKIAQEACMFHRRWHQLPLGHHPFSLSLACR
ncbi:delta-1-pyrroline-5-carboxylate reductase [Schizosaccharomyces japonicus yFS275]|uniref:Delta-1-pyrroline-5-carboxylate reductase n=1 Tax=Schizosaccharomyces japonicus (strain yFS275 / FY16936) TaxID=402676 RepID=B6JXI1_SCHJY|nr:delta-1-pyrroline-5-carboxylate reductase [Schizosaccharomyces japonicus yFS275]EEB05125.2 delta-1-pyrroline-5-carboxylate reductase [Schizosaccharomyces japonicus yFS275]